MRILREELARRRRFGMKPGLEAMRRALEVLGNPQKKVRAIHVAGTNGKGAVCALLDAALTAAGYNVGRYTSPHLVSLNERFFLKGAPVADEQLDAIVARMQGEEFEELTYFEYLTVVAFCLYAEEYPDFTILETGLGGRLDATNLCVPELTIITRVGLDHCAWLGNTLEQIASEKAGIIKREVPIILGANAPEVQDVIRKRTEEVGAAYLYAPDRVKLEEVPTNLALAGSFNRENAQTAMAVLKALSQASSSKYSQCLEGFAKVVWLGRFQRIGRFIVDGAHNPPAAKALSQALTECLGETKLELIAGFCADKDSDAVLRILAPHISRAYAVRTSSPRSLPAEETARRMQAAGMAAQACPTLSAALSATKGAVLICGSLFLAGEALVELGALSRPKDAIELSEQINSSNEGETNK